MSPLATDHLVGGLSWREAGDGPPIVFLHGLGGTRLAWEPQLEGLSDHFRCIAWDMPGYGDAAPAASLTFPGLADSIAALLDCTRSAAGAHRRLVVRGSAGDAPGAAPSASNRPVGAGRHQLPVRRQRHRCRRVEAGPAGPARGRAHARRHGAGRDRCHHGAGLQRPRARSASSVPSHRSAVPPSGRRSSAFRRTTSPIGWPRSVARPW